MDSIKSKDKQLPLLGKIADALKSPNTRLKGRLNVLSYLALSTEFSIEQNKLLIDAPSKSNQTNISIPENILEILNEIENYEYNITVLNAIKIRTYDWCTGKKDIPDDFYMKYGNNKIESMHQYFIASKNEINHIDEINKNILQAIKDLYLVSSKDEAILERYAYDKENPYFFLAYAWNQAVLTYAKFDGKSKQKLISLPEDSKKSSNLSEKQAEADGSAPLELDSAKNTSDEYYEAIDIYNKNHAINAIFNPSDIIGNVPTFTTVLEIDGDEISFNDAIKDLNKTNNTLLIYGVAGAGKTFLLVQNVMRFQLASDMTTRHVLYIPLNGLGFTLNPLSRTYLKDYIQRYVFRDLDWELYYNKRNGKELWLFLDAFNEVPVNKREHLAEEIVGYSDSLNCKIIITSRYEDMLAQTISYGKKASVKDLTEEIVAHYLKQCRLSVKLQSGSPLFKLLTNPLMLTLFGKTTPYQRSIHYQIKRNMCNFIDISNKDVSDTHILLNYLNCEVLKARSSEETFLAWLSVHFFWSKLAFDMQKDNTFHFSGNDLLELSKASIEWLKKNYNNHSELKRIKNIALIDFAFDFDEFIVNLNYVAVFQFLLRNQALFGGTDDKYKFLHQSVRDSLAAVHLLNVVPTDTDPFPADWSEESFSNNIYMLHHLAEICKLEGKTVLNHAVEILRKRDEILPDNFVLRNLLLVLHQPSLLNGDFSQFDFSNLDLRYCELTDYKVSDNGNKRGAYFGFSKIGETTFKLQSHSLKITSIAISSDGRKVLSCGKDKILLWNFLNKTIEKEIHSYLADNQYDYKEQVALSEKGELALEQLIFDTEKLIEHLNEGNNEQVLFSTDDKFALYSDRKRLMEYNLKTGEVTEYITEMGVINRIIAVKDIAETEYYLANGGMGNIYRWRQGGKGCVYPDEVFTSNEKMWFISPTYNPHEFLAHDENFQIMLVNDKYEIICKYDAKYTHENISVSKDKKYFAVSNKENFTNQRYVDVIKVVNIHNQDVQSINVNRYCWRANDCTQEYCLQEHCTQEYSISEYDLQKEIIISFSSNGKYLLVIMKNNYSKAMTFTYKMEGEHFAKIPLTKRELNDSTITNTAVFHNNYILYAEDTNHIQVNEIIENDDIQYNYTKLDNHSPFVHDISFSQIDNRLYAVYENGNLREWDYENGIIFHNFEKRRNTSVNSVVNAYNNHLIATGDNEGYITVWDSDERRFIRDAGKMPHKVSVVSFTYDDEYIVTKSGRGLISIWTVKRTENEGEEEPLFVSLEHSYYTTSVLYYNIENEQRVVIGDRRGNIVSYRINFKIGKFETLYIQEEAHSKERILSLALSSDGKSFISYGEDGFICEWDAEITIAGKALRKVEIESGSTVNANSCQYSDDSSKIYFTTNADSENAILITEVCLQNPGNRRVLYKMKNFQSRNEGIIKIKGTHIISGDNCGNVYYYNVESNIHKVMPVNYSMFSEKIRHCTGFEMAIYYPKHLRNIYIDNKITEITDGKLNKWLQEGVIPNFISLANHPKLNIEIAGNISELSSIEKISSFADMFVSATNCSGNTFSVGERMLLESCMVYLSFESQPEEQNMLMICQLLHAGYNRGAKDEKSPLAKIFELLEERNASHIALKIWHSYISGFGDNNRTICDSLLKRLEPVNITCNGETEFLTKLTEEKIHKAAYSLTCNSDSGKANCPTYFTVSDEAQVLFLKLLFHYLNTLPDEQRTLEKAEKIFKSNINEVIDSLIPIATTEMNKLVKELQGYISVYSDIEKKNRFILSFWLNSEDEERCEQDSEGEKTGKELIEELGQGINSYSKQLSDLIKSNSKVFVEVIQDPDTGIGLARYAANEITNQWYEYLAQIESEINKQVKLIEETKTSQSSKIKKEATITIELFKKNVDCMVEDINKALIELDPNYDSATAST